MSLGMTAELTGGNSRQQILDLLNAENIDSLRKRANAIWNAHYHNDGATSIILASSVWLDSNIEFSQPVMDILAQNYYASSYAGVMGSDKLNQVFYQWLDEQTGGLLKNNAENIKLLDADTLMSLATTVLFQAKWDVEFNTDKTSSDTFHALSKDITCDFMHSIEDIYYWGDKFGAVSKKLENYGGTMWFILPDEGVAIEDLINDNQAMEFILSGGNWENQKRIIVNFALPKFDIFSQTDLSEGFKNMGVTDIFDGNIADFSPMLDNGANVENIFVSKAQHDVKVSIDEEGVTAATYTVMRMYGAPPPPEDEIDFILNRPFLFAIADDDGLPLFVGIVNYPK